MEEQVLETTSAPVEAAPSEAVENISEASTDQSGVNEGIEPSTESPASENTEPSPEERKAAFRKLINEDYKDEATELFKERLGKRFKKHDEELANLQGKSSAVDELIKVFGVDDVEALKELARTEAVKKKAYDLDVPEEVVSDYEATIAAQQKELSELKGQSQKAQAEEYLSKLESEIMEFVKEYSETTEMELLSDDALVERIKNGESIEQAFFGLYPDKAKAMIAGAANAKQAAEINKGKGRPAENISGDAKQAKGTPKLSNAAMMKLMDQVKSTGRPGDASTGRLK